LPGGRTQIVLMDDTYATRDEVPEVVTHRITATFAPARADQAPYVGAIYPDEVTQEAGTVRLGEGEPLRIGPPLQGAGWVAVNACCEFSQHRGAMLPVGGRINGTERYAIDWIQIEPERAPETLAQGLLPSFRGDPERNEDYLAYGQPLLAVGDGTVVKVVDHYGDATPQHLPPGLGLEELGGNTVIIDLGDGFYAFYAHVKPGSITVSEGDRVRRGDVIGRLGNSGNSTEAHLHFHVMRGLAPLAAINWPFVIDEFDVEGSLSEEGLVPEPAPGPRRDELVLIHDVTSFPVVAD
jgi:murein DD-endopeptidase MepM/ murein hydrolase activator NlpD